MTHKPQRARPRPLPPSADARSRLVPAPPASPLRPRPFNIVRAQGASLKVGVLLPRSGVQAGIGQDCQRGVEITPGILKDLGCPRSRS